MYCLLDSCKVQFNQLHNGRDNKFKLIKVNFMHVQRIFIPYKLMEVISSSKGGCSLSPRALCVSSEDKKLQKRRGEKSVI